MYSDLDLRYYEKVGFWGKNYGCDLDLDLISLTGFDLDLRGRWMCTLLTRIWVHWNWDNPPGGLLGPERYGYVRLDCQTPYPLPFMYSWKTYPLLFATRCGVFQIIESNTPIDQCFRLWAPWVHLIIILRTPPVQRFPFLYTPPVLKMLKKTSLSASHTQWSRHMSDPPPPGDNPYIFPIFQLVCSLVHVCYVALRHLDLEASF